MPALSSSRILVPIDDTDPVLGELADVPTAPPGLWQSLTEVPDPRKRRGVRHPFATIIAIAMAATIAGARSYTAIAEWAADHGATQLLEHGIEVAGVPSESAIRRTLQRIAVDHLESVIGSWMWLRTTMIDGHRVIAFDGKTLRGARSKSGDLTHLLAGLCQRSGAVVGQVEVGPKTNEIPTLRALLATMDITGAVITADAMHCQRDTAEQITTAGGHYILTVKNNQPKLRKLLKALPWHQIPVLNSGTETGHGRVDTRTLKATEITEGIGFPGAVQVLQITRRSRDRATGKKRTEIVYAVSSMAMTDATPGQLADWLRGHWRIENSLHWVRDVVFDEDRSQIRTAAGPQVMAALRNTAISILRLAGETNIASALRHHQRHPERPVTLLLTC